MRERCCRRARLREACRPPWNGVQRPLLDTERAQQVSGGDAVASADPQRQAWERTEADQLYAVAGQIPKARAAVRRPTLRGGSRTSAKLSGGPERPITAGLPRGPGAVCR